MSQKDFWTAEPGSMWTNPPHIHSTTKSICKPLQLPPSLFASLPRHPCPFLSFSSFSFRCTPDTRAMIFTQVSLSLFSLSSSSVLPPSCVPSHKGQDAVDEQGHDGSAEQAGHRHCHEPSQEDVPEEAPVHCFLGTDPTHGHDWAHLEAAARREERKQLDAVQNISNCQSQRNAEELQVVQAFFMTDTKDHFVFKKCPLSHLTFPVLIYTVCLTIIYP